jgi:hypothetical protein
MCSGTGTECFPLFCKVNFAFFVFAEFHVFSCFAKLVFLLAANVDFGTVHY